MATAEEILARTATPETEPHIVIGRDRSVTVPVELKEIAVQFDHNIETVVFDCPRYWDGHDLSAMRIFVNFLRPDKKAGQFPCTDVTVDDVDPTIMHFSWVISGHATEFKGELSFLVCAKALEEDGTLKHRWSSHLNQEMSVREGMNVSSDIASLHPDIITFVLERLENLENTEAMSDKAAILRRLSALESDSAISKEQTDNALRRLSSLESDRPMYLEERSVSWDGISEEQYMSADHPTVEGLVGSTVMVMSKGVKYEYPIVACCSTQSELDALKASQSITKYAYITVGELLRSTIVGQLPGIEYVIWLSDVENPGGTVYYYNNPDVDQKPGLYCTKFEETDDNGSITYRYPTELTWREPTIDPRYQSLFDNGPVTSTIDLTNFNNGSFTETINGRTITHTVAFDGSGRPVKIDGTTIVWG